MAEQRGLSRRHLIAGAGVLGAAGVAGALAVDAAATDGGGPDRRRVDFHGAHQAGIATPVQGHLHFASYDVTTTDRAALVALLQDWTAAAREMTADRRVGGRGSQSRLAPPSDTGEAVGLDAANLTLTVGFGPGLFDDRFGLAASRPAALADLPAFPGDTLDAALCGGDLAVQACSDDPQVAVHAVRNLTRIAAGRAAVRWAQLGFGKASATETTGPTPRNLFGFKDGTANVKAEEGAALDEHVWVGDDDAAAGWLTGGSYLVARRIGMAIEVWDRQPLGDQESFVGRTKGTGAPLSGGDEMTEPDFDMPGSNDQPVIPSDAHVRVVHPDAHGGVRMLRRGYNFVDGSNALGGLDAGLFFIAYVRDPGTHFVPVQLAMSKNDALTEYLEVTGSALFAVPPGAGPGEHVGQSLFA